MKKTYRCLVSDRQGRSNSELHEAADYTDLVRQFSDSGKVLISYEEAKSIQRKT